MRLDRIILSALIAVIGVLVAWAGLYLGVRFTTYLKRCLHLRLLRRQGRTVSNECISDVSGVVLCVEVTENPSGVQYWWVPSSSELPTEAVVDRWIAGEAFAFDCQKEMGRLVGANLVPTRVVRFREVSCFNTR
jgi:hypothetical protein